MGLDVLFRQPLVFEVLLDRVFKLPDDAIKEW